jgi:hypothetical protein
MKINFGRRAIETICTFLAYYLLLISLFVWLFYQADNLFNWDILSENIERIIERLLLPSVAGIIFFAITISVLINFSLISINIEKIADNKYVLQNDKDAIKIGRRTKKSFIFIVGIFLFSLLAFQIYDKWEIYSRKKEFENIFITSQNLAPFDSLISSLNLKDTIMYRTIYYGKDKSTELCNDSCFGLSNIKTYQEIQNKLSSLNQFIDKNLKGQSLHYNIRINFNNTWMGVTSSYSFYNSQSDHQRQQNIISKYDIVKDIFEDSMEDVKLNNKDGYEIYYKIRDSRHYKFVILLKSNPISIMECNLFHVMY